MSNKPLSVVFSYFDELKGPVSYLIISDFIDSNVAHAIASLMDLNEEGAPFIHSMDEVSSLNLILEVPSALSRGRLRTAMISVVFGKSFRSPTLFEDVLIKFGNILKKKMWDPIFSPEDFEQSQREQATKELKKILQNLEDKALNIYENSFIGKLLIVGLHKAGKTSVLNVLKNPDGFSPAKRPTLGVNIVRLVMDEMKIRAYDVGGQKMFRDRWYTSLRHPNGIVFVHDISEESEEKIKESEREFERLSSFVNKIDYNGPLLVLFNKIDKIDLESTKDKIIRNSIFKKKTFTPADISFNSAFTSAQTGEGVIQAFHWLVSQLGQL